MGLDVDGMGWDYTRGEIGSVGRSSLELVGGALESR